MKEVCNLNGKKIINGDCLEVIKTFEDKTFDIVCTSPPYNIKMGYSSYSDDLPYKEYLGWLEKIFIEIKRVLKDDGSFFLNVGSTCKQPFIHMDVCVEARKHFILQNDILWVKSISIENDAGVNSYGHFKPITSDRFLNQLHESIFHFTKDGEVKLSRLSIGVPYQDKSNIERWKHTDKAGKVDKRCRGNLWFIPYKTVTSRKDHPAGYPVELVENCIKLHGKTDAVVLDPFLGSGTTLLACQNLGATGIGIELDESYSQIAFEKLNNLIVSEGNLNVRNDGNCPQPEAEFLEDCSQSESSEV